MSRRPPALASAAPKPPPTPPAPITAIRMSGLLFGRSLTGSPTISAKRDRAWRKWIASSSAPASSVWRWRARWRMAGREVIILEAAEGIGTETSSRNSEVIHAGIYYPANSLMARFCVEGRRRLYPYCRGARRAARQLRQADRRHERAGGRDAGRHQATRRGQRGRGHARAEPRRGDGDGAGAAMHQRAATRR